MKRKTNEPMPRIPPQDLPGIEDLSPVDAEKLLSGDPVEECLIQDIDLSGRRIPSLAAWTSVLQNVSLASSKIGKLRLRDVRLVKCDLSNAVLQGFEAARVVSRLTPFQIFRLKLPTSWQ